MASQVFTAYKLTMATTAATDDWRCILCSTSTDADTIDDDTVSFISDIVLDEFDGANYPTGASRKTLSTTASRDNAGNRAEVNAPAFTFTALGNGTRPILGALIYKHIGADTANVPIRWIERTASLNPGGEDVTVTPDSDGIYQIS